MIELRRSSDQQIMRDNKGEILQAIVHVLKLMYGYDYRRDRLKHLKDIIGWCYKIAEIMDNDPKSHGTKFLSAYFDRECPFSKNKQKIQTVLKRYDPKRVVTKKEYIYANSVVFECINKLDDLEREKAYDYLFSKFPKKGFDEWDVVEDTDESLFR